MKLKHYLHMFAVMVDTAHWLFHIPNCDLMHRPLTKLSSNLFNHKYTRSRQKFALQKTDQIIPKKLKLKLCALLGKKGNTSVSSRQFVRKHCSIKRKWMKIFTSALHTQM